MHMHKSLTFSADVCLWWLNTRPWAMMNSKMPDLELQMLARGIILRTVTFMMNETISSEFPTDPKYMLRGSNRLASRFHTSCWCRKHLQHLLDPHHLPKELDQEWVGTIKTSFYLNKNDDSSNLWILRFPTHALRILHRRPRCKLWEQILTNHMFPC